MKPLIRFFTEVGKLKGVKRRGWLLRGVKDPETVADHSFRVLVLAWILSVGSNRNIKRLLKIGLVHSLSAVHINYISPYHKLLETKNKKELLKKYPALVLRAPIDEKGKIIIQRFKEEEEVVEKLTQGLPSHLKETILFHWRDFQKKSSKEAKFLWLIDKLENLIQALEYKNQIKEDLITPFLQQIEEITSDKDILNFAKNIEEYFQRGTKEADDKKFNLINFFNKVGELKKIKRIGWVYGGAQIDKTESIAGHSFRLALMTWCLASKKRMNLEKIIKMSIVHDIMIVYTGDITPFDDLITGDFEKDRKILEDWPRRTKKDKEKITIERRLREKKAFDKLLKSLPISIKDEILSLWFEYEEGFSKEGRFVRQVDRIEKLLQAIEYHTKGIYKPNINPYWVQLKTLLDDSLLVEFVEEVDKWFFGGKKAAPKFVDKQVATK